MFIPFMYTIKVNVSKICVVIKQIEHLNLFKYFSRKFMTTLATNMINIIEGTGNDWLRFKLHKTDCVNVAQHFDYFALPFSPWKSGQIYN
jgi:hypothetical protein